MYREILRQIEREGYGASPGRAVVARSRKLLLAARGGVLAR
jgi:phytoene synthase